ncbi:MAG TPA: 3-hydroxyacyl-CoA dehydrogenase family protein, partial [Candidatus Binatia bacterium]|nr:3-hydroxyacyl-CoA dehydrogenase family protein [Candidatus Binatia bacterium]
GLHGRKNERGFYLYNGKIPVINSGLGVFQESDWARDFAREELQRRMVLLMVNEAARCLEEKIVAQPADADFAMIMGTGFAPFRGGPLRYAERAGIEKIVDEMKRLAEGGSGHFTPCALLQDAAAGKTRFYPGKGVGL